jgi:predicted nucleic acid-binding protein
MVSYVLDSSAILRYLDDEAGADRVAEIIKAHLAGGCEVLVSALHWGEVAGVTRKLHGKRDTELVLFRLGAFGFQLVPADSDRAVQSALIKLNRNLPYLDAFGVQLTSEMKDRIFVTADFDFKAASREVKIEFLPAK